ncbi:zinc-dependent metalloprotease [Rurimicrobium arvi]|uniref:T9SS type A sorting domain-containing protein n=1 Tax=Rurimicrobium arvi TaxID=2049916 RepID=A0ABP8MWT4_9BACT
MKSSLLITASLLFAVCTKAQDVIRCGQEIMSSSMEQSFPGFKLRETDLKKATAQKAIQARNMQQALMKTATDPGPIPVVFHIVVDTNTYIKLGSNAGIAERVRSQLEVLNADFNGANADKSKVPAVWSSLYANVGIRFASAHVDPTGGYTPGYDVKIVASGTSFSAINAAKGVKFTATGGTEAWDPKRYLNVWVTNLTASSATVLGITAPPYYSDFTIPEWGIAINSGIFGARTSASQYFLNKFDHGRTLTHEMGHYFYIWHTWGDDGGTCDGDDGISDTPLEGDAATGNPKFPRYDVCTPADNGIMFMNYMDYTDDTAMYMFTQEQANVMQSEVAETGHSYSLTLNPYLSDTQVTAPEKIHIGPNPSKGILYLTYNNASTSVKSVVVYNIMGQKVIETTEANIVSIDMSHLAKGVYFVQCICNNQNIQEKIILQ